MEDDCVVVLFYTFWNWVGEEEEEEKEEKKTKVWLTSSILSGIELGRGGDGNEDDCVVVLFNTLWNWVGRRRRRRK
jgi:hypothetical protein